jgi:hypothetical protein
MFSFTHKKSLIPINKKMSDYCKKSTNESIRKITEKCNEERKTIKIDLDCIKLATKDDSQNPPKDDSQNPPNDNNLIISVVYILYSTTIIYYFYKYFR